MDYKKVKFVKSNKSDYNQLFVGGVNPNKPVAKVKSHKCVKAG